MERSHDLCWMCHSRLGEADPGIRFDIPEAIETHSVVVCRVCHAHPKRDQIARNIENLYYHWQDAQQRRTQ